MQLLYIYFNMKKDTVISVFFIKEILKTSGDLVSLSKESEVLSYHNARKYPKKI